jgi:hypothetical protein
MSTSSFTGTIMNFSPKPDEDYYGILIDNGTEEKWLNGKGNPDDSWSKGDKVKVKANMDEFIEIEEINVLEDGQNNSSGGEKTSNSNAQKGSDGGEPSSTYVSKDERINKKVAFKEACETARQEDLKVQAPEEGGEHIQLVAKLANGYYQVLQDMGGEE